MRIDEFESALLDQCNTFRTSSKKRSKQEYSIFASNFEKIQVLVLLEKIYASAGNKVRGISVKVTTEPKNFKISMIADKIFETQNKEENALVFRDFLYD